jgi:hypothetical protein
MSLDLAQNRRTREATTTSVLGGKTDVIRATTLRLLLTQGGNKSCLHRFAASQCRRRIWLPLRERPYKGREQCRQGTRAWFHLGPVNRLFNCDAPCRSRCNGPLIWRVRTRGISDQRLSLRTTRLNRSLSSYPSPRRLVAIFSRDPSPRSWLLASANRSMCRMYLANRAASV